MLATSPSNAERDNGGKRDTLYDAALPKIEYLVYYRNHRVGGEILVYIDKGLDLKWECDDTAEEYLGCSDNGFGTIQIEVATLEHFPQNWPKDLKISTKRMLGEAIALALQKNINGAKDGIERARKFIEAKSQQVSRYWTLQACITSAFLAIVLGIVEIGWRPEFETMLSPRVYILLSGA
jgi:hypothetical protein